MTESPFAVTSAILNEQTSVSDELRIVACDGGVKRDVRHVLIRAADELDMSNKTLALCYGQLCEANARLSAVQDQIRSLRKAPATPLFQSFTMQIGPTPMIMHPGYVTK